MVREGKPEGFFYLDHRTVDGKHNFITDIHVTAGNDHDSRPYLARLDRQPQRFGFSVDAVALDAGYLTAPICHALKQRDIFAVIAHRRFRLKKGLFHKWQYKYDEQKDVYTFPAGYKLAYRTTNRQGYREYKVEPIRLPRLPVTIPVYDQQKLCEDSNSSCMGRGKGMGTEEPFKPTGKSPVQKAKGDH